MFCCSSRDDGKNKAGQARTIETRNAHQQQHYDQYNQPRAPPGANIGQGQQQPQQTSGKPVGVGIVFQPDSTGALHVKSLAVNGPAEKSGQVSIGDVLHEIDGHHVYRKPVAQLAPLILGQEGTVVRLGLQRGTLDRLVFVDLRRGWSLQPGQGGGGAATPQGAGSSKWSHPLPQGAKLSHFSGPGGRQQQGGGGGGGGGGGYYQGGGGGNMQGGQEQQQQQQQGGGYYQGGGGGGGGYQGGGGGGYQGGGGGGYYQGGGNAPGGQPSDGGGYYEGGGGAGNYSNYGRG